MSLTSILKEIDRVNRRQDEVERRYNRSSKGCPRKEDLQREEQEDQHIFGYSHSQMLAIFHHTKPTDSTHTRPSTPVNTCTLPTRPQTALDLRPTQTRPYTGMRHCGGTHGSSAGKLCYRQQFNFLFKEDIFDQNHEKMRRKQALQEQNCQSSEWNSESNERKMSRMLLERSVPPTVKKMHSKSIKAERLHFIKSFDDNLARMKGAKGKKLNRVAKNHVFYSRTTLPAPQQPDNDFFRLTKAPEQLRPKPADPHKKIKVVLSNSVDNLRELEPMVNQVENEQMAEFKRESSAGRYPSLLETNFISYLPPKFTLTCIAADTLQSARIPLVIRNNSLSLAESRETVNLGHVLEQLLGNHPMVHLVFHSEGGLLYEETLVSQPYRNMHSKEHQILLLMYYLQRFLLFDHSATIASVRQSTDLLLKSNVDLPDDFADFTETFGSKLCRIYDTEQRLYQFCLGAAIANGLASVLAFKKEMGFGQKVVKLKHGTREQFKKYLYNWEYFYI